MFKKWFVIILKRVNKAIEALLLKLEPQADNKTLSYYDLYYGDDL